MPLGKAEAQTTRRSGERRLCPGIRSKRASAHMLQAGTDLSIEGFKGSAVGSRRSDPESVGDLAERCAIPPEELSLTPARKARMSTQLSAPPQLTASHFPGFSSRPTWRQRRRGG